MLERPLRLGTPQPRRRHLDLAEGVAFDPEALRHDRLLQHARRDRTLSHKRKKGPAGPFPPFAVGYLMVAAPALQTTSSCEPVPPEQPMAPISLPPSMIGIPPRDAMTPSSVVM